MVDDSLFTNDIPSVIGEANFPLWIDGVDTSFAPFVPTPLELVREALKEAWVGPDDELLDLGCGDGRFCLLADCEFKVKSAVGLEIDSEGLERAVRLREECASARTTFELKDFNNSDVLESIVMSPAITVMVVVLTSDFQKAHSEFLRRFLSTNPKRRIVSVFFNLDGIQGVSRVNNHPKIYVYQAA